MARYVALLRGINVGGNNLIKMAALRSCFERQGFADVATYIASGNVLFSAPGAGAAGRLAAGIELALAAAFDYKASVVLRSQKEMRATVARAPARFGGQPDRFRYDVIFLKAPLTAAAALKAMPANPAVDELHAGPAALYVSRLTARVTASRLGKVVALPMYQNMTIRNWNTTTNLLRLLEA